MKFFIAFIALFALAMAQDDSATIVSQDLEIDPEGTYKYAYETSNGISAQESGNAGVSVSGSAKWSSPDGVPVEFTYTADEEGYKPSGDILPVGPEIPELIKKALEYLAAHPPAE